jgi:hypothetical protein
MLYRELVAKASVKLLTPAFFQRCSEERVRKFVQDPEKADMKFDSWELLDLIESPLLDLQRKLGWYHWETYRAMDKYFDLETVDGKWSHVHVSFSLEGECLILEKSEFPIPVTKITLETEWYRNGRTIVVL